MNIYRTEFFALCPNNGIRIKYRFEIRTTETIPVERIVAKVGSLPERFHEELADSLHAAFGGSQTLVADHHSVTIETTRGGVSRNDWLDETVGGMAGTPGY